MPDDPILRFATCIDACDPKVCHHDRLVINRVNDIGENLRIGSL